MGPGLPAGPLWEVPDIWHHIAAALTGNVTVQSVTARRSMAELSPPCSLYASRRRWGWPLAGGSEHTIRDLRRFWTISRCCLRPEWIAGRGLTECATLRDR